MSRLWWNHWKQDKTERHAGYTIRRLEADVFTMIGNKPVNEITAAMLKTVIRKVKSRDALDIAKRVLTMCGQVMRYAVAHDMTERNPEKPSDVLKPNKKTNYARLDQKKNPNYSARLMNTMDNHYQSWQCN